MKKLVTLFSILSIAVMAGCGANATDKAKTEAPVEETEVVSVEADKEAVKDTAATEDAHNHATATPTEPGEEEMCSMCNMIVYPKDHEMGKFTGQVVTADGKHLFADDLGCLINQVRILEEEPQGAWVRDYNTLEWVPVKEATAVRASIETPMKMGFALFGSEDDANKFVTENPMLSPVITDYEDVDKIALERRKAKLAKQKAAEEKAAGMNGNMNGEMNGQMNHN